MSLKWGDRCFETMLRAGLWRTVSVNHLSAKSICLWLLNVAIIIAQSVSH